MHLAVDRYLRGSLSEKETAEFEERLVWDQALMDEVDLAEKLREGLRVTLNREDAAIETGFSLFDRAAAFFEMPAYAAAASFMLAVGLTSVTTMTVLSTDDSGLENELPTEIVALFATRSDEAIEIRVAEDSWTVLLIDAPYGYQAFRASVMRRDDTQQTIWSREGLEPTYPESLAVGMPGKLLPEGEYLLTLEGSVEGSLDYERIQQIAFDVSPILPPPSD